MILRARCAGKKNAYKIYAHTPNIELYKHNFKSTVINSFCFLCEAVWHERGYRLIPFHSLSLSLCAHLFAGRHTAHTRIKRYDWNVLPVFNAAAEMHLINYLTIMAVLKWHFDGYINIYVCILLCEWVRCYYAHLFYKILIWNVQERCDWMQTWKCAKLFLENEHITCIAVFVSNWLDVLSLRNVIIFRFNLAYFRYERDSLNKRYIAGIESNEPILKHTHTFIQRDIP